MEFEKWLSIQSKEEKNSSTSNNSEPFDPTKAYVNTSQYMNETLRSGYIPINPLLREFLFFILVESRNKPETDPLIIWLQGDCSSEVGMLLENGPQRFTFEPLGTPAFKLQRNNHSWSNNASVLYLDFPLGSGFSQVETAFEYRLSDQQLMIDFYQFMRGFMKTYPEFKGRPLFLFG